MSETKVRSIYMTYPDVTSAERVARALVEENLVACANIFAAGRSLYKWQGEIQDETELVMIAKTSEARLQRLIARVKELHPYDTPCIVALAALGGDEDYLAWVEQAAGG